MRLVLQAEKLVKLSKALTEPKPSEAEPQSETDPEEAGIQFHPEFPLEVWTCFGLTPRKHQAEAHLDPRRFRVDVWHRRAGKSTYALMRLLDRAYWAPAPRSRFAYLGPTYSQVQDIIWSELVEYARRIPGAEILNGALAVYIPTHKGDYSRIRLYGVDSPKQRLRGSYLDGVILDEFQDIPESVWSQQVRPMLADQTRALVDKFGRRNQWAVIIGTPKGKNQLFQMWDRADRWSRGDPVTIRYENGAVETVVSNEWAATRLSVWETGMLSPQELAQIKAEIGPTEFAQEFEVDFEIGVPGAVLKLELDELRASDRLGDFPVNNNLPVYTAWDLGWNDASAVWFFQVVGGRPVFIDFLMATNASIPRLVELVKEKGYRLARNYFPWDVAIHDLSGDGKSRAEIFRRLGLHPTPVKRVSLADGIAALRRLVQKACFDRIKCADGLELLAQYRREKDATTGLLKQEPIHDISSHAADALRTAAIGIPRWSYDTSQAGTRYQTAVF